MTDLEASALKNAAMKATAGPWEAYQGIDTVKIVSMTFGDIAEWSTYGEEAQPFVNPDAAYIALANPAAILSLLADHDTLTRERDEALMLAQGPSSLADLARGAVERGFRIVELEAERNRLRTAAEEMHEACAKVARDEMVAQNKLRTQRYNARDAEGTDRRDAAYLAASRICHAIKALPLPDAVTSHLTAKRRFPQQEADIPARDEECS